MAVLVVLLLLLLTELGISQSNYPENNINTPLQPFCGRNPPINQANFINNRNSTFVQLRSQISRNRALYARAQALSDGDSVYGAAQCRNYLSTAQCVACFDAGVSELVSCSIGNGARVFLDNCFIRYENFADFYNNPTVNEDVVVSGIQRCGNQSSSQQTTNFTRVVDGFLSDIRDATPRTSNFYIASIRQVSSNATVYAVAQCVENTSQTICQNCMVSAYNSLSTCLPSAEGRYYDIRCFARYSTTQFFNDNQTIDMTNFSGGKSSNIATIAGAIGGAGLFFFLLAALWLLHRQRKKSKNAEQALELEMVVYYNYKDLQLATNNFSQDNILGRGGFGEVFKAILDDKNIVAVKKLHVSYARVKAEFENEVRLINDIHHRNLLRLLGWSNEGSNLFLVLEYMPNGSLDRFLWGAKRGTLNWKQRFDIILGIAKGLAHLHNELHVKIIHRDIKSGNILLGDDFKPKIADFGLARFHPEDQTHVSTKFAGTLGYAAPEYALNGILSDKVDTYSFGIVILEIISGRRCNDININRPSTDYLLEHAWKLYEKKIQMELIDETLDVKQYKEHVTEIIEIALLCTQSPVSKRPTMSEVVLMLQDDESLEKRQLTRPTFVNDHDRRIHISSSKYTMGVDNFSKKAI